VASIVQRLEARQEKPIHPPTFLPTNIHYEALMGSRAYGVNSDESTDFDVYGFCIPPKDIVFPHIRGIIPGFGNQGERFEQWQQAHVRTSSGNEYDFQIYNIVKYFQLCMDNNPDMIDSLFVPDNCVLHITSVGNLVRDNRKLFLSKRVWPRFKGYAYAQLHKLDNKQPVGKRALTVEKYGYDTKYAYHIWRLLDEAYQALAEGDINLQRCREECKAIRRGEWTEDYLRQRFEEMLPILEEAYAKSKLPERPSEDKIKALLLNCLEHHYGNLKGVVGRQDAYVSALRNIDTEIQKIRASLYGDG
jgi:uncharacterized protein